MRRTLIALLSTLSLLGARPLHAQAAADSAGLARAVAEMLAAGMIEYPSMAEGVWNHTGLPFDSAVARLLVADTRLRFPRPLVWNSKHWSITQVSMMPDSARVRIELREQVVKKGTGIMGYTQTDDHFFERRPEGWVHTRGAEVRHADWGAVRG